MRSRKKPSTANKSRTRQKFNSASSENSGSSSGSDDDEPLVSVSSESSDSSSDDSESNSDDSFQTKVAKKRLTRKVQKNYKSGIKRMMLFAESDGFVHCVNKGKLITPLPVEFVAAYFEHLSNVMVPWRNHDTPGKTKNYAPKTHIRVQSMIHDL